MYLPNALAPEKRLSARVLSAGFYQQGFISKGFFYAIWNLGTIIIGHQRSFSCDAGLLVVLVAEDVAGASDSASASVAVFLRFSTFPSTQCLT